ncbi:UNVERIFIED_CONTAM: hypothetical protein FKN15_038273 [Acipenser sinensis]
MKHKEMVWADGSDGAVFLREFTLIRRDNLQDESLSEILANHKSEDLFLAKHGDIKGPTGGNANSLQAGFSSQGSPGSGKAARGNAGSGDALLQWKCC